MHSLVTIFQAFVVVLQSTIFQTLMSHPQYASIDLVQPSPTDCFHITSNHVNQIPGVHLLTLIVYNPLRLALLPLCLGAMGTVS